MISFKCESDGLRKIPENSGKPIQFQIPKIGRILEFHFPIKIHSLKYNRIMSNKKGDELMKQV